MLNTAHAPARHQHLFMLRPATNRPHYRGIINDYAYCLPTVYLGLFVYSSLRFSWDLSDIIDCICISVLSFEECFWQCFVVRTMNFLVYKCSFKFKFCYSHPPNISVGHKHINPFSPWICGLIKSAFNFHDKNAVFTAIYFKIFSSFSSFVSCSNFLIWWTHNWPNLMHANK